MRVLLVSGPANPGTCGITDYTRKLANALQALDIEAVVYASGHWALLNAFDLHREIRNIMPDFVHIQYPTAGFGCKLGPQALSLLQRCIVTIHEASQTHILRKLALLPFSVRPRYIIFPSSLERKFGLRWVPWLSSLSSVIPIPSNIRRGPTSDRRSIGDIIYFGLIMPKKGLEDVLRIGALIERAAPGLRIQIIGTPPPKHRAYCERLRAQSSALPIIWHLGLSEEQVAVKLASSSVAYLPYPDGASERRASLKAALLNGVSVITTRGVQTPAELAKVVRFSATPEETLSLACSLFRNAQDRAELADKGHAYAVRYTWEAVAHQHALCYQRLLGKREPIAVAAETPSHRHSFSSRRF
jgi:glycosyltransferase involved in cell wall biosynthesis